MRSRPSPIRNQIGNVFVPVSDMPRSIAWYSELFGLDIGEPSHGGTICEVPMQGETGLILDANKPVTERSVQPLCFFWTDDMAAALDHLRMMGVEITSDITDIGSVAFLAFRDPDDNPLMICQRQSIR